MQKFSKTLRDILARLRGNAPKDKPAPPVRCEFCGQPGHATANCPNSAKYPVFSVDHDAEDDPQP
jgi:hypothetical protein